MRVLNFSIMFKNCNYHPPQKKSYTLICWVMLHVGFPGTQILRQSQNKHAGYFKPHPWNQYLLIGKGICGFRQRKESIKNAVSKSSPYHMERAGARPALQNYLMLNQVSILHIDRH